MQFIDETEADLIALVEADFGSLPNGVLLQRTLMAWLHYRARLIALRPRTVRLSTRVQALQAKHLAIGEVAAALRVGADLSPRLSDGVRHSKSNIRADLMFNDWQISHFHLGPLYYNAQKIKRGKKSDNEPVLYAHIGSDSAALLDVRPHGDWAAQELLRILLCTDPDAMNEMKGVMPSGRPWTDEQIYELRRAGVTTHVEIDGQLFMSPGLGVTGAGSASRITAFETQLSKTIRAATEQVKTNTLPYAIMQKIASRIGVPVCVGVRFYQGLFYIYEKNRQLDLMYLPRVLA